MLWITSATGKADLSYSTGSNSAAYGSDISNANMRESELRLADLTLANLSGAVLDRANVRMF